LFQENDNSLSLRNTISIWEKMRIEDLSVWEAFVAVATHQGFTSAAKKLGQTPSQLSKKVAKLEGDLGVRLFQRSTRTVSLTDEGAALVPKVQSIIDDLTGLEQSFSRNERISGTVKITSVPYVAHRLFPPLLSECSRRFPDLQIDLELTKQFVSLIDGGYDMAIRIEMPKVSELVYNKLAPNDLIFCATPQYLESYPKKVRQPMDLMEHKILSLSLHDRCKFKDSSQSLKDVLKRKQIKCDNGVFLTDLALQHQGILVRSKWAVEDHLKSGALIQVLKNHPLETFGHIYAVIPSKRYLAPRVRAVLDLVKKHLSMW
jgi:DNA-binding transcriptional LysR family regulator